MAMVSHENSKIFLRCRIGDWFDVSCDREREIKEVDQVSGIGNWMGGSVIAGEREHRGEASLEPWDRGVRRKLRVQCWKAGIEMTDGCPNGETRQEVGYWGLGFGRDSIWNIHLYIYLRWNWIRRVCEMRRGSWRTQTFKEWAEIGEIIKGSMKE